jgi:AcrR family transcriptional regulator
MNPSMVRYGEKQDGRVTRAQRARAERRTAVLAAAQRIFAEKGYSGTSIDDIIEAADIARGTFYLYFESKRAIFDELLDELFTTLQSQVKRIEVGPGALPPVEQMDATVDRVMQTLLENREMARILLREAVGIDDEFDAKLAQFYGRIEALIISAIQTGQSMSLVRKCDAELAAHAILGAAKELVHWAFVKRDPTELNLEHLGRELIAFTLKGLFV